MTKHNRLQWFRGPVGRFGIAHCNTSYLHSAERSQYAHQVTRPQVQFELKNHQPVHWQDIDRWSQKKSDHDISWQPQHAQSHRISWKPPYLIGKPWFPVGFSLNQAILFPGQKPMKIHATCLPSPRGRCLHDAAITDFLREWFSSLCLW